MRPVTVPAMAVLALVCAACDGGGTGGGVPPKADLPPALEPVAVQLYRGQTEPARAAAVAYLETHPGDGFAEFLIGLSHHREKAYAKARPHFDRAVGLVPAYHPVHHFQGWCLYWLGEMPAAREAFERHLRYAPNEGDSHFALGVIALDEDRLDEAEARLTEAIRLSREAMQRSGQRGYREVAKGLARLAEVHVQRGDLETARTLLEEATRLHPQHYQAFYKLSRVLTRLGEEDAAEAAFAEYRRWQRVAEARRGVPERRP